MTVLLGAPAPPDGAARRGFAAPTVLDALHALASVVGAAAALELWSRAAAAAQVHGVDLPVDEHVRVVEHLVRLAEAPAARAAAVSHLTRLRAHRVLSGADR